MKRSVMMLFGSLFAVSVGATACAHHGETKTEKTYTYKSISNDDFARIPRDMMGPVDAARVQLRDAHDASLRADHQVSLADKRIDVERATAKAEKTDVETAKKKLELARATGDKAKIDAAQKSLDVADAEVQLGDARVDLALKQRDLAQQRADVSHRLEDLAIARLEAVKLDALRASNDASAKKYDRYSFEQEVYNKQIAVRRAEETLQTSVAELHKTQAKVDLAQEAVRRAGGEERVPVRGEEPSKSSAPKPEPTSSPMEHPEGSVE
jgi:hypothetical protein